jgi:transposase
MPELEFSTEDVEALRYWRFHHPHPHVQQKMEIVYLRSQKLENKQIQPLCGISKATFYRYLHEYRAGGVEQLKVLNFHRSESQLVNHKRTLEDYFREHPPATSAEAAARIEELSGIKGGPTQTRKFLKAMGMKPRKVGQPRQGGCQRVRGVQRRQTRSTVGGSQSGPAASLLHGCRTFCLGAISRFSLVL